MNTSDAIGKRRSVRSFTSQTVSNDLVEKILSIAKQAPTGGNMQPWQVAVVRGETKQQLGEAYIKTAAAQQKPCPEVPYYPEPMPPKYNLRRHHMGVQIYQSRGVRFTPQYVDWAAVIELQKQNYYFFGADVGLLFFIESDLLEGSLLDIGMFMQNIMLVALDHGLDTCPQASWGNYPDIAKEILGIGGELRLICGMSLGYRDQVVDVELECVREDNREFVRWYE